MIARSRAAAIWIGAIAIAASIHLARADDDDRDGDGVPNNVDACPDTPGPKAWQGCPPPPDRDGDHVPDSVDLCPDVAGLGATGCPQYRYAGITRERVVLDSLRFVPKRARILPQSWWMLDDLAQVLRDNRRFQIVIVAHDEDARRAQQRAAAVRAYLMKRHVAGARLRVEGQGPAARDSANVDFLIARRR